MVSLVLVRTCGLQWLTNRMEDDPSLHHRGLHHDVIRLWCSCVCTFRVFTSTVGRWTLTALMPSVITPSMGNDLDEECQEEPGHQDCTRRRLVVNPAKAFVGEVQLSVGEQLLSVSMAVGVQ